MLKNQRSVNLRWKLSIGSGPVLQNVFALRQVVNYFKMLMLNTYWYGILMDPANFATAELTQMHIECRELVHIC